MYHSILKLFTVHITYVDMLKFLRCLMKPKDHNATVTSQISNTTESQDKKKKKVLQIHQTELIVTLRVPPSIPPLCSRRQIPMKFSYDQYFFSLVLPSSSSPGPALKSGNNALSKNFRFLFHGSVSHETFTS